MKTDIVVNCHLAEDAEAAKKFYEEHGSVEADDITATLVHVLSAPPNVQVSLPLVTSSWHFLGSLYTFQSVYHISATIEFRNLVPYKKWKIRSCIQRVYLTNSDLTTPLDVYPYSYIRGSVESNENHPGHAGQSAATLAECMTPVSSLTPPPPRPLPQPRHAYVSWIRVENLSVCIPDTLSHHGKLPQGGAHSRSVNNYIQTSADFPQTLLYDNGINSHLQRCSATRLVHLIFDRHFLHLTNSLRQKCNVLVDIWCVST